MNTSEQLGVHSPHKYHLLFVSPGTFTHPLLVSHQFATGPACPLCHTGSENLALYLRTRECRRSNQVRADDSKELILD